MSLSLNGPTPRVLVFDSGVGGLSIVHEIQQKLPTIPLIYASDNAFFPYGTKGEDELIVRVDKVLRNLTKHYSIDIIVVACNTASTLTLPHIRSHFFQPIVGVVPAIKPAATLSKSGVIGLLATPATVVRPYTHNLIREYASDVEVISVGSSELVLLAEQKLRGEQIAPQLIRAALQPFFDHPRSAEMDTLVLACTHFPLLRNELQYQFHDHVKLVDSGEAIARRVVSLLGECELSAVTPEHLAVFTKSTRTVAELQPQLHHFEIYKVDILEI